MGISDKIKGIGELVVQVHDADLKIALQQRILDLQGDCFELQEKNASLLEENGNLKNEIHEFIGKKDLLSQLKFERNVYWKLDIPYCPACFGNNGKLIPLSQYSPTETTGDCPSCKYEYAHVFGDEPTQRGPGIAFL